MFKTILVPTDFSEVSLKAIKTVETFHPKDVDKVILLHVLDIRAYNYLSPYYADSVSVQQELMKQTGAELETMAQNLEKKGFSAIASIASGIPVQEILKAEKENNVSLIVMGSHGKSNLAEIFLGSVAEKVMRKCTNPILLIKR